MSYLFPPAGGSGVVRTAKLARHLPHHAVDADFLVSRDAAPYLDREREAEIPDGVVVARCPGLLPMQWGRRTTSAPGARPPRRRPRWRDLARSWLSVPDRAIYWAPFAIRRGCRLGRQGRYDAVYGVGGPWTNLLVASSLSRRLAVPLVVDFKEAWGAGPPLGWPTGWRRELERRWERAVVLESAAVICASRGLADDLLERIPALSSRDLSVIHNGFEPGDYEAAPPPRMMGRLLIVHTGYVSRAFSVRPVLHGLALARARGTNASLRFVGEHDLDIGGIARAAGVGEHVEMTGPVSYREAVREQLGADALLVLGGGSPLAGGAMPSKTYEYLGAGRPILAVVDGNSSVAGFLESMRLGPPADPHRPEMIADRIVGIGRGEVRRPDPEKVARFRWSELVGEIASVIVRRVSDPGGAGIDPRGIAAGG